MEINLVETQHFFITFSTYFILLAKPKETSDNTTTWKYTSAWSKCSDSSATLTYTVIDNEVQILTHYTEE